MNKKFITALFISQAVVLTAVPVYCVADAIQTYKLYEVNMADALSNKNYFTLDEQKGEVADGYDFMYMQSLGDETLQICVDKETGKSGYIIWDDNTLQSIDSFCDSSVVNTETNTVALDNEDTPAEEVIPDEE